MPKQATVAIVLSTLLTIGGVALSGCHEGPGERVGEKIDRQSDTAKDKLNPDGAAERAGKKVDKTVDDITK